MSNYTKELLEIGGQRRRLTEQLQTLVMNVADKIAESCENGTAVEIPNLGLLKVDTAETYLGDEKLLYLEPSVVFNVSGDCGSFVNLNGDQDCKVLIATREQFLTFANRLPEIISAFKASEKDAIAALRNGFEALKKLVK